jgi:hypothetical protein
MPHSQGDFWFVNTNIPKTKQVSESWVRESDDKDFKDLYIKHGETCQHQLWWQVKGKRQGKKLQAILRRLNSGKSMRVYLQLWDGIPF